MLTPEQIDDLIEYHAPTEEQIVRLKRVRYAAKEFISAINVNCPDSADKSAAIRQVREALMTANASIVLEPKKEA